MGNERVKLEVAAVLASAIGSYRWKRSIVSLSCADRCKVLFRGSRLLLTPGFYSQFVTESLWASKYAIDRFFRPDL
jgi:hypothetical protein